jgi:Aminotransferase class I and II
MHSSNSCNDDLERTGAMSPHDTTNAAVEQKRALAKKLLGQKRERDERRTQVLESLPDYTRHSYEMYLTSDSAELAEVERFHAWAQQVRADDGYTFELPRLTAQRPHVVLERQDGTRQEMLNFSSYNYLGYGYHPEVIQAAKNALDTYGLGAGSSPVISGTFGIHKQLEQRLAGWVGGADYAASVFSSGYGANLGTISAWCTPVITSCWTVPPT